MNADPKLAAADGGAWDVVAKAVSHGQDIFVRNMMLERSPPRLSPLLEHAIALNRYAAEIGKPDGQRLEEYSDANFPALKLQITAPAPIHVKLEKTVLAWWLTKVREDLGTSDGDVRKLMGKRSPEDIAAALVDGTKLTDAKLRTRLLTGGAKAINAYHDPLIDFARVLDPLARAVRTDYEAQCQSGDHGEECGADRQGTVRAGGQKCLSGCDLYTALVLWSRDGIPGKRSCRSTSDEFCRCLRPCHGAGPPSETAGQLDRRRKSRSIRVQTWISRHPTTSLAVIRAHL